jgi:hypothetical protein
MRTGTTLFADTFADQSLQKTLMSYTLLACRTSQTRKKEVANLDKHGNVFIFV